MAVPNPNPKLLNGISSLSIATSDETIYHRTVAFYQQFGFTKIHSYSRGDPDLTIERFLSAAHAIDSIAESWLNLLPEPEYGHKDASEDSGITLKIRLSATGPTASQSLDKARAFLDGPEKDNDWRSVTCLLIFETHDMDSLLNILDSFPILPDVKPYIQLRPNEVSPIEVFAIDPVGNAIGFTLRKNPFSVVDPGFISTRGSNPQGSSSVSGASTPHGGRLPGATALGEPGKPSSFGSLERKKIAVMTSGGDAPGMNACVRAVVRTAIHRGCDVYAVFEGYDGLVKGGDLIKPMTWDDVRGWLAIGGTNIGTARCATFRERYGRLAAARNMIKNGIDALIVCGGDGSLTGADTFREEWPSLIQELVTDGVVTQEEAEKHKNLYICGTVGSIDNDMATTDATIGAFSSLERICQSVDYIDATAQSHSRAFVIEVMGRHCGWLALMAGIATGADFVFIPERPPAPDEWQHNMCKVVKRHRDFGKRKTIVIVAEGAIDTELNPISSDNVKDVLVKLGLDTRVTTLGHVQRGGNAVAFDRLLATLQGVDAVDAILSATPDSPSPMIGITENKIVRRDLMESVALTKSVATAIKNKDFDKAMSLRNPEFSENWTNFMTINSADKHDVRNPAETPLNIAIINVGAPAGGMNSSIRAMAAYCYSRGHRPYAIHNGFSGLARHESVRDLDWLEVEEWIMRGGSEIGTNRTLPECDIGMIAYYFQKYKFDGLIIVGGYEGFASLHQLQQARTAYPAFRIPMVCIPATISNNVPGTEYSLGTDTCLNALVEYCDVIKQSASASRRRVFVVEVQGGNSGYITAYAGLVTGAHAIYLPEEGISLRQLESDIDYIKDCFENDQGRNRAGKLILRNERSSNTFSTEIIVNIIRDEAKGRFEARTAIPGHVQQGGNPSPLDRVRATRFAIQACKFIEDNQNTRELPVTEQNDSAVVVGIRSSKLVFSSVSQLWDFETEHSERRPKKSFWYDMARISDVLVGRPQVNTK
ncbi:uncharacterized protein SAPINGB_P004876 [Magnusiomyces paraingens]|uniref:ATP-dependent 6-phosphofructokinase n=1 Tax=Magnusiomyces paraingens TaxID=2606893 RepID=A0A5E8BYN4_9ASCO|nr:uncharacterized protein SAPINGB_P004876 [Saprochaete ingens]VVT56172.1 unnamed protein product [Saprochaete ingens]